MLGQSLTGKALDQGLWRLETIDLRTFGEGRHRNVDDTPAGGGAGMVIRADVLARAIRFAERDIRGRPGAHGRSSTSRRGGAASTRRWRGASPIATGITLICGRFEGIDERAIEHFGIEEVSLGDFVMTGRRDRGRGGDRRDRAAAAGRAGQRRLDRGGELLGRASRASAVHATRRLGRPRDPRGPDLRRPRRGGGLAAGAVRGDHARPAAGPVGGLPRRRDA
jgi:hypothetical protein